MSRDERRYIADAEGERLDRFLTRQEAALSRSHLQKWIEDGRVTVGGKARKANYKLRLGEAVEVDVPEAKPVEIAPEAIRCV